MIERHIPEEATGEIADIYQERFPNYCTKCGGEMVVAGGRITPDPGFYDHIDPVIMCGDCGKRTRHTAGVNQAEGQEWIVAPGANEERNRELFGGLTGYCDIHGVDMVPTKALLLDGRPMRQCKCPVCDREAVIVTKP